MIMMKIIKKLCVHSKFYLNIDKLKLPFIKLKQIFKALIMNFKIKA